MLVCLGWQGYLSDYIGQLVTILNYKPIELTTKLRALVKQEASAIGPYDMMFYSEVTKDLGKLLTDKDVEIAKNEIQTSKTEDNSAGGAEPPEEEKVEEKKPGADPAKPMSAAAMMKMMAASGKGKKGGAKGGAAGKAGGKGGKGPPAGRP